MNVLYSSDDNYAQHLGASLYSLLSHNLSCGEISIYIIDNAISPSNRQKLQQISDCFPNSKIIWIDFQNWIERLKLNMPWKISISAYGRLFVGSMLPESVGRVLYLDSDTVINSALDQLWETDLSGFVLGAVQDSVGREAKQSVGLDLHDRYVNSGVLLIDLDRWRELGIEQKCMEFIADRSGSVVHHDQGVINGVLHHQIKILPIENNVMTIHYMLSTGKIQKYFGDLAEFYEEESVVRAKENPVVLHYTPSFTCHPWEKGCKHPYTGLYWESLKNTPWKNARANRNPGKWYVRLYEWRFRTFPL